MKETRNGFLAALAIALLAFIVADVQAQTSPSGYSIMRVLDGTTLVNPGDNTNTAIRVNVVAGSAGGPSIVDDAAFTVAVSSVAPSGFMFDDVSPDSVNEGDAGIGRMSANRNQYMTIRDAAGNERGVNVNASSELLVNATQSGTWTVTQSGTWTVQPGNTANSTPWVVELSQSGTKNDVDIATALPAGTNSIGTVVLQKASSANNDGAQVSVTTTSGTVLASFSTRIFASICSSPQNTDIVYLKLGATATTSDYKLWPNQCFNTSSTPYTGVIDARSATGTQEVSVLEW